jgi:eukaryotic-like serine/threonine-protein kinase
MKNAVGTRLGPYEIVGELGAGGMGEVYRARDTRLGREVAIKVLPDEFPDADARQRFEREARIISQLSHPRICALHDIGRDDSGDYLVMELLEGDTLATRVTRGPLPIETVLAYGADIASALAAAHARGIVHRDLKPANVMITKSGIKLLDFGLAKMLAPDPVPSASGAVTAPLDLTETGTVLGTLHYMSPEQLEGRTADERTDIFALGIVLFEMATGKRPYAGSSRPAIISALMAPEPPSILAARPDAPPALDRLIRTCLAKDPAARWDSAHDLELRLREIRGERAVAPGAKRGRSNRVAIGASIVAALAIAGAVAAMLRTPPAAQAPLQTVRFQEIPPGNGTTPFAFEAPRLAVSPDGLSIAYIASDSAGASHVWVRSLDAVPARELAGTDGANAIFWSWDGRSIGFFTRGALQRVDLDGGVPVRVCAVEPEMTYYATWGSDGSILFAHVLDRAIHHVPAAGGTPDIMVAVDSARGEAGARWPCYLPDGIHFMYLLRCPNGVDSLMIDAPGERPRAIMASESNVQYSEPGFLMFVREGTLLAQRFDWHTLRLSGSPFPVADHVRYFLSTGLAGYSTSRGGTLVYQSGAEEDRMVWFDRTGKELGRIGPPAAYLNIVLSPDARRVLCARAHPATGTYDVWSFDLERGVETAITSGRVTDLAGQWLPGMRKIAHSRVMGRAPHLLIRDLDTGKDGEIVPMTGFQLAQDVSPDGRTLLYSERNERGAFDLWTVALDGHSAPVPFLQSEFDKEVARFSPDGRYVAYMSTEAGSFDVFVSPFPGPGESVRVTTDGAQSMRWARLGSEILYLSGQQTMRAVPVQTTPRLHVGAPATLFATPGRHAWRGFDLSADGKRILAIVPEVVPGELPLNVVVNWPAAAKP